jgi:hypothetical protein
MTTETAIPAKRTQGAGTVKRLSQPQHIVIRAWVLGGFDAVPARSVNTVKALWKHEYLDKSGPTEKARVYVDQCEREDLAEMLAR